MNTSTNLKAWTLLLCFLICTCMYAQTPEYVPDQFIIKMKPNKSTVDKLFLKNQMQAVTYKTLPLNGIEVWQIPDTDVSRNIEQLIREYRNHPDIEYIEPNYYYHLASDVNDRQNFTPDDTYFGDLWGLHNTGQNGGTIDTDINASEAWNIATGSPSVVVALIDSGVDWNHPDLAENIWQNLGEDADGDGHVLEQNANGIWIFDPGDIDTIDNDNNGYLNDFIGWDFINDDNDPFDNAGGSAYGHGTHVAGTIGAVGNNGIGVSGVTWDVQIAPLRVFANATESGDVIIEAITYALNMNMPISNNSYENLRFSEALENVMQIANNNGHLFVAAAGNFRNNNDTNPNYPVSFPFDNIIGVTAIDRQDNLWVQSPSRGASYGATSVDIGTPGAFIQSTHPYNSYDPRSGTSMATPHVTGACALLKETYPNASYLEIKDAILNTVTITPALTGKCTSDGRLNLYEAMNYLATLPPMSCRERDSLALVAIHNVTPGGITWWNFTQPMDTWNGVQLDQNGCVNYLYIPFYFSSGVPVEITYLDNLETLFLNNNNLTTIPPEIGNMTSLKTLGLGQNDLATLPPEITNLTNLIELYLFENNFTTFPPEIGDLINLQTLHLFRNGMTSLSPEIGNLINLSELWLQENALTTLPLEVGNLMSLTDLNISNNSATGCFDENLINLCDSLMSSPSIDNGNNFDATWSEFCSSGAGTCNPYSPCRQSDSLALVALYNSTNGVNWDEIWNLSQPIDTWHGVTLNSSGCVTCLDLDGSDGCSDTYSPPNGNNLTGTLPPEIGNLSELTTLILSNNPLNGSIPPEIGNLSKLERLYIQFSTIGGVIPPEIGNLINLETLELRETQINGVIPSEIGNLSNLKKIYLWDNMLAGIIPMELGNLPNLEYLYLVENQLSGTIPPELFDISTLKILNIASNGLTGTIPVEVGNAINLTSLQLAGNNITGSIPPEIGNLINLGNLGFAGTQLSGSIPTEIQYLDNLAQLVFFDNQLSGSIPTEMGNMDNLSYLWLNDNMLTGEIPDELGNLNLTVLRLQNNQLTGNIPPSFGDLSLYDLRLENNQLSGCYDTNLSKLCSFPLPGIHRNMWISDGNNFDVPWEDFCNTGVGTCTDLVWPGDYNYDGTVNEADPLYWGLAAGLPNGLIRPDATTTFEGQQAPDWPHSVQGINGKHQDGNGDGIVDGLDLQVVSDNFGSIHAYTQPVYIASGIQYILVEVPPVAGDPSYDLYVYDSVGGDIEAHGMAGILEFYDTPVDSIIMRTDNSSLAPSDTLTVYDEVENRLYFALTRNDKMNQTCNGPVANFRIIMENIPSGDTLQIAVENGSNIQANGDILTIAGMTYEGLSPSATASGSLMINTSVIHVQCDVAGSAWVIPIGGIAPYTYQWNTGETTDRITDLTSGIYDVTVMDGVGDSIHTTLIVEGQYIPLYDANGNPVDCLFTPCPTLLTPDGAIPPGTYQADRTINSDGTLTGDTNYKAGETIILKKGFEIPPGTEFSGTIEECDGN